MPFFYQDNKKHVRSQLQRDDNKVLKIVPQQFVFKINIKLNKIAVFKNDNMF